jgi:short-subunit dehydrogenase
MAKTALVTGAGSGIGRGMALALAQRGYHLVLVGRNLARLQAVADEVRRFSSASIRAVDLSDRTARVEMIENILSDGGAPTLLVNNAALMPAGDFCQYPVGEIDAVFSANLLAPAELTRSFCVSPTPTQGVIFILSTAARFPQPYNSLYSASKAGLRFLAESLQVELAGKVRICLAYPPLTDTSMTGRFAAPPRFLRKASATSVAETIIKGFEAGRTEISWFDWELVPSLFYRIAPHTFRSILKKQRAALQAFFHPSGIDSEK